MLSIAHTATGAFLATKTPNPVLGLTLAFASHYLLDYIIHWDVGTGLSSGKKTPESALKHELIDMFISFVFLYLIFQANQTTLNTQAWAGAFLALVPDFLEAPRNFFKWEPAWLKPFNDFHSKFHNSTPDVFKGLTPQLVLLLFIALTY